MSSDAAAQSFTSFVGTPLEHPSIPPVASKLQELPFTTLPWIVFEQFCCRLIAALPEVEGEPYLYGVPGQDQKGIDIVARVRKNGNLERWCFQCRRVEHLTKSGLLAAIQGFEYAADHYVFLIASRAGTDLQDIIEQHDDKELWDSRILSRKVKNHPCIVADFFGEWWIRLFIPDVSPLDEHHQSDPTGTFHPPVPDPHFIGRENQVPELATHLARARSISVEGPGGIGKTQLLVQALAEVGDRPTLWIDVESYRQVSDLRIAVASALQQLGIAASAANLVQALHAASIRIVFDGVEQSDLLNWDDLEDFFRVLLSRTQRPQFVFTSQLDLSTLAPEVRIRVKPLEPEHALVLLLSRGELRDDLPPGEADALASLVAFSDGHPLTLRLVAGQIQRFGSAETVIERIHEAGTTALNQQGRKKHTKSTSLNVALQLAFESTTDEQRLVLLYASFLPGGAWALMLGHLAKTADVESDLAELFRWNLFERHYDPSNLMRYQLLSPVRAFVQARALADSPEEAEAVRRDIARYFAVQSAYIDDAYMQFGDAAWGIELFEMELPNFLASIFYAKTAVDQLVKNGTGSAEAEEYLVSYTLARSLAAYFFARGHLRPGIDALRSGINAGRVMGKECGSLFSFLVRMLRRINNIAGMRDAVADFEHVAKQSSDGDVHARHAVACADLASVEERHAEADVLYQKAEVYYTDVLTAMAAERTEGSRDSADKVRALAAGSLALVLAARAVTKEKLKDYQSGLRLGLRALSLIRETGDRINPPNIQFHIGRCQAGIGDVEKALKSFEEAAEQFYEMGTQQYLGNSLAEIGALVTLHASARSSLTLREEIIEAGLDDVIDELHIVLSDWQHLNEQWGLEVLRKLFAVLTLATYTLDNDVLASWAIELKNGTITPLASRDTGITNVRRVLLRELDLIAGIGFTAAQLLMSDGDQEEQLEYLSYMCSELVAWGWDIDPFEWMATWLNVHKRENSSIAAHELRAVAERRGPA